MNRFSILFLKLVIVLIAGIALVGLIRFPQTEGRAANLDLVSIYADPFIIYIYIASIPFFVALYQAIKLLSYIHKNQAFSQASISSVKTIKSCALAIIGFMMGALAFIFIVMRNQSDDIAGGVATGIFIIFITSIVTAVANVFQKILQTAIDKKVVR